MVDIESMQQFVRDRSVIDEHGCWIWQRRIEHHGYGRAWFNGAHYYAHRFAYLAFVGPVPEGLQLDHLCRVRACCNPRHLEAVTGQINIRRGRTYRSGTSGDTCSNGHALTPETTRVTAQGRRCRVCLRAAWTRRNWRRRGVPAASRVAS